MKKQYVFNRPCLVRYFCPHRWLLNALLEGTLTAVDGGGGDLLRRQLVLTLDLGGFHILSHRGMLIRDCIHVITGLLICYVRFCHNLHLDYCMY